jgi:hypothetical protein
MASSLCQAPFVYNSDTDECESYTISPPDYCLPENDKILVYNANTKLCEFKDRIEKGNDFELISIVNYPTCSPGTTQMPDKQCKSVSITQEPNRQQPEPEPEPQPEPQPLEIQNMDVALTQEQQIKYRHKLTNNTPQPLEIQNKDVALTEEQQIKYRNKLTNNTLKPTNNTPPIFIIIIFIIILIIGGGAVYYFKNKKK